VTELRVLPIEGVGEIEPGDDVAAVLVEAAGPDEFHDDDIVVIAHKVVSKAEGRIAAGDRREIAAAESARVLRRSGEMLIAETRHGFVCANAGVDASNIEPGKVVMLPLDPDLSARRIRKRIELLTEQRVGVVISDTFGRTWRLGQTNIAIGCAGIEPFVDYRNTSDDYGNDLVATRICVADELAGAAELVMGKTNRICAAIVRGAPGLIGEGSASEIVRPHAEDLFR
jgi:coenzyme F420-0:L-glutamate ligase/coenzyme F420-1:gamma-L-glutamate ligase